MPSTPRTRRQVIGGIVAAAAWCCADHAHARLPDDLGGVPTSPPPPVSGRSPSTVEVFPGLHVHPRDEWGADLPPRRSMAPEDVRLLLVHHTASSNAVADPRAVIRGTYAYHTSSAKNWPDVCYNFFIAPDGSVFEGRAGSLDGPVVADASGGNQGFSQLVCLIGNFVSVTPTPAAQASLVRTLAWLAGRYDLNTFEGATTTFTSRGSDKYPAGSVITTPVVSPHRAVTYTACPGDAAVAQLPRWRSEVHRTLAATWRHDGLQPARRLALEAP